MNWPPQWKRTTVADVGVEFTNRYSEVKLLHVTKCFEVTTLNQLWEIAACKVALIRVVTAEAAEVTHSDPLWGGVCVWGGSSVRYRGNNGWEQSYSYVYEYGLKLSGKTTARR